MSDLGGGLGIPEKPGETALDLTELDAAIARVKVRMPKLEIWLEPGRFIVARAGVLVSVCAKTLTILSKR